MGYIVIARKYRPRRFEDVVGQEGAATTLRNAIATGRIGHAYLFAGPRGVGKTSMARIFSMALNCDDGPSETPCGRCRSCEEIYLGRDIDVMEIDGASNRGIDEIRAIRDNAVYSPSRARFRIFIIDEVHMLTLQAFNALLKILEEPPAHVKFIFATTRPQNIPDTIRSRCQRFDFRPVPLAKITARLKEICGSEKVEVEDRVLEAVGRRAGGAMRDAQSLLDQLIAVGRGRVTLEALESLLGWVPFQEIRGAVDVLAAGDIPAALGLVEDLFRTGRDPAEFLLQLEEYIRDLLLAAAAGGSLPVAPASAASEDDIREQMNLFSRDELLYLVQVIHGVRKELSRDIEGRILLETSIVRMASVKDLPPLEDVIRAVEPLTWSAETGGAKPAAGAAPKTAAAPEDVFAAVAEAWPGIVARLRRKHTWASYLADAKPIRAAEGEFYLGFYEDRALHRDQISRADRKEVIQAAIREATGADTRVICTTLTGEAGAVFEGVSENREDHKGRRPEKEEEPPIIRSALQLFDGKVVQDEEEK
jgi:DNA polymerase-3 subunit gamma/tau